MEFNRAQLKQSVKLSMKGTTPNPMLVALLFTVVVSVGTALLNAILGGLLTGGVSGVSDTALYYIQQGYDVDDAMNIAMLELFRRGPGAIFGATVGAGVLSLIISLWSSTMNVSYEGYCLSMVRNEQPPLGKIFGALPQFGSIFVTRFLTGLFMFLWTLLVVVAYVALIFAVALLAALTESVVLVMITVLIAVAVLALGIVWVSMRYVLVDYVLLDKGLYGLEAIRENKRLMKGNIGKAFVLQLSFIGWYLLVFVLVYAGFIAMVTASLAAFTSLNAGVGVVGLVVMLAALGGAAVLMLWMRPYVTGTMAKFYDWAKGAADGFAHGPSFGGGSDGWSEHTDYTWNAGTNSGTGTGTGFGSGNGGLPPKPPKTPRDDPWN